MVQMQLSTLPTTHEGSTAYDRVATAADLSDDENEFVVGLRKADSWKNVVLQLVGSVGATTAMLFSTKAMFSSVHSPSPHNRLSVAVFLALLHQIFLYITALVFCAPIPHKSLSTRGLIRLVVLATLTTIISYWSLMMLPLETFQQVTLIGLPFIILYLRRNPMSHYLPVILAYIFLIGGVAWMSTEALSNRMTYFGMLILIINFAVLVPFTGLSCGRTADIRSIAPWSIILLSVLWMVLEALQSTNVMLPRFWTKHVIAMVIVSGTSGVVAMLVPTSARSSHFAVETQIARLLIVCAISWIAKPQDVTPMKIAGLGMIISAALLHWRYPDRAYPYISSLGKARSPSQWKTRRQTMIVRLIILCIAILVISLVSMVTKSEVPRRSSRSPIMPFAQEELLHVEGNTTLGFDRIYMVNLARRADRREIMASRLHKLDMDVYITPASTYQVPAVIDRLDLLHSKPLWGWFPFGTHLSRGEVALTVSELRIFKDIVYRNFAWSLILEDDVIFDKRIATIWNPFFSVIPNDADLLYLGWCDNPPGERMATFTPNTASPFGTEYTLAVATHPSCTHAFAVSQKAAKKMLKYFDEPHVACDDAIVELVNLGILKAYSMHPPLIDQDEETPSDLAVQGWWLPFKRLGRSLSKGIRGVSEVGVVEPVRVTEADRAWARNWRARSEVQSPWRNDTIFSSMPPRR